tara:strand:- start:34085 stop:34357 length:273 start_codon:yes stop_codon:yes gene_type:complete
MTDAKATHIALAKTYRKSLDDILQEMKRQLMEIHNGSPEDFEDWAEAIAQHTLSIRDLESAIMRQGMTLKSIGYEQRKRALIPTTSPSSR